MGREAVKGGGVECGEKYDVVEHEATHPMRPTFPPAVAVAPSVVSHI